MKKLSIILSVLLCLITGSTVEAARINDGLYNFNDGGNGYSIMARLYGDSGEKPIVMEKAALTDAMQTERREYERAFAWTMEFEDASIDFPETRIRAEMEKSPSAGGPGRNMLGKDYRLFYVENDALTPVDLESGDEFSVKFTTEKTGTYVIYYDPRVYRQTYYTDDAEDEDGFPTSEIYYQSEYMEDRDPIDYPQTLPQKDGYIFIGWAYKRANSETPVNYGSLPIAAMSCWDIYAKWCPEDEYIPINAEISASSDIIKGKEDGSILTVKITNGKFSDFMADVPEDDTAERNIRMELWREKWKLEGVDGVSVRSVNRVDDKTVNLILKGNSSDKYSSSDVYLNYEQALVKDITVQIDENGFMKDMLRSDNSIKFKAQAAPSGGGGSGASSVCTVRFDNGTDTAAQSVKKGKTAAEPSAPKRDGYVFGGWYTDKECTEKYSFDEEVSKSFTLYAKWEKADSEPSQPEKTNTITLTVGKTDANVFGSGIVNDVAPVIKNDVTMLPSRFVAESLGAEVEWLGAEQKVLITKGDTKIEILIGSDTAYVNDEAIKLMQPAFIENDRTFTPIRFISEQLGADVDWNGETGEVTITKK